MNDRQSTPSIEAGTRIFDNIADNDRCDLTILLRDAYRHKIIVRDSQHHVNKTKTQSFIIRDDTFAKINAIFARPSTSDLSALIVSVFHWVLGAHSEGSNTVLACIQYDKENSAALDECRLIPSLVKHAAQTDLSCDCFIEILAQQFANPDNYDKAARWLNRGLFDALVVWGDSKVHNLSIELPFALLASAEKNSCKVTLSYADNYFEDKVIKGLLDIFQEVLQQLVCDHKQVVSGLEFISKEQRVQLDQWNDTDGPFPDVRLETLFEQAVQRAPEKIAIICHRQQFTYRQLDNLANGLAKTLLPSSIESNAQEVIAICLNKNYLAVTAILAIWKAGKQFVPIDIDYPLERLLFTLTDAGATHLLTNQDHISKLKTIINERKLPIKLIAIEEMVAANITSSARAQQKPKLHANTDDTAYITYTSGTTGFPKGVPKEHSMVVNSITDLSVSYDMTGANEERVALFASLVFEPFMRQTLIALINTKTLVIVPDAIRLDPLRFPAFVAKHKISYLNGTPSVLQHFNLRDCPSLKRLLLVGEELTQRGLQLLRQQFSGQIINEYAFTETAFVSAIKVFPPGNCDRPDRSIGRPMRNVKCYVLTQDLKRVPIGAIGELYIGGAGVARGYLNRDDLTAERFIANPFQTPVEQQNNCNQRIYKTGDMARILPNGELEFMGRSDFQLKLNGIRVEPGEIEANILKFRGIRQCIVVPVEVKAEMSAWRLVAYYVTEPGVDVSAAQLRTFLSARLINVMVPTQMIKVPHFRVNTSGKIDRAALPKVSFTDSKSTMESTSEKDLVNILRSIWARILAIPENVIKGTDDFFQLGAQSITCTQLLAKIWQELRIATNIETLYQCKTLNNLAAHLEQKFNEGTGSNDLINTEEEVVSGNTIHLRANGLQQGLMYQALKSDSPDQSYIMQTTYRYKTQLNEKYMHKAWQLALERHPCLRLRFEWQDEANQIIDNNKKPLNWRYFDLSHSEDPSEQATAISDLKAKDRAEPYPLSDSGLYRVYCIKQAAESYTMIFSCHHIILDGWSVALLFNFVHETYSRLMRNETINQTIDNTYIAAQRYRNAHRYDHIDYWNEVLQQIDELGDFSGLLNDQSRYKVDLNTYDKVTNNKSKQLTLDSGCIQLIKKHCAKHQVTLHSVLQFVWHQVLHAIGDAEKTVVGTIVSGRNLPVDNIDSAVGLFINTLPLVVDHQRSETETTSQAMTNIQQMVNKMNSRSIVELGDLQVDGMKRRLFDTLLVLENYPEDLSISKQSNQRNELCCERAYDFDKVDYPIAVVAREGLNDLDISLWYAAELFDDETIEQLLACIDTLFHQLTKDFDQKISALEWVPKSVLAKYTQWNQTDCAFPTELTLSNVFERAAEQWPNADALVFNDTQLNYHQLNERANQLANYLLANADLRPNDIIALLMDKSEWMIIAILGIWKAGVAYVPIDSAYPDERIKFMLDDTKAKLIIADSKYEQRSQDWELSCQPNTISIQHIELANYSSDNLPPRALSTDLAYAIYTSGTTGKPKAVLVEHRGVVNLHASLEKCFQLNRAKGQESILSFSNYVFDHFVEQMTDALLSGQKLVLLDDAMRTDKKRLYRYMRENAVTYLSGTPSVLSMYDYFDLPALTRIDAIGEDFTIPVFNKIRASFSGLIINGYGPTEISITSHKRLYPNNEPRINKSIGLPVANTRCYVLNQALKRVPIGGIGELYIGGIGVTRGYLNRDELTQERFLANPFQTEQEKKLGINGRIYKTGDQARWLPNGELEYLGRSDMQVKIRGLRVELGEIESVLSTYPGITRSLIIARESNANADETVSQKYLVGFYLSDKTFAESDMQHFMRQQLPDALVPTRIIKIDAIPITRSGKLDVAQLPATELASNNSRYHIPPANEIETELGVIWSEILGLASDAFGTNDSFFRLGGDSLRAVKLIHRIDQKFACSLSISTVFNHETIAAQGAHIVQQISSHEKNKGPSPLDFAGARSENPPLSLAQERLLFIDDFVGGTAAYNIPFVLKVPYNSQINDESIQQALLALLLRQNALRTCLQRESSGVKRQQVLNDADTVNQFTLPIFIAQDKNELDHKLTAEASHVFQLSKELPFRACLVKLENVQQVGYLSLVFHHIAFDGWSWNLFREALARLLQGEQAAQLGQLTTSYADFALWQRQRISGQRLQTLSQYWDGILADYWPLDLPLDRPRPKQFDYIGKELIFDLDANTLTELKHLASRNQVSLYSLLLSAYGLLLKIYTNQDDIVLGSPCANRLEPEFNNVIGFFANLLVIRIHINNDDCLADYVQAVGASALDAQLHQELPFEQIIKSLQVERDPSRHPVVQAVFSLINETLVDSAVASVFEPYVPNNDAWTTAKFDLSLTVSQTQQGLACNFTYAATLFDDASIKQIGSTYRHILQEFIRLSPQAKQVSMKEMAYVPAIERSLALSMNQSPSPSLISQAQTLNKQFEAMVTLYPDREAVVYGKTSLSYQQLNHYANQLAHHLLAQTKLHPDTIVGLLMDKSEWMIVAILAAWKAGLAYLPIDPQSPDDRIDYMLTNANTTLLLANEANRQLLARHSQKGRIGLCIDDINLSAYPAIGPATSTSSTSLAYAIFTSGTTGKPKAVLVTHGNVLSFHRDITSRYSEDFKQDKQTALLLASYSFDFSIEQLALSILSGNKLLVPETGLPIDDDFYSHANEHQLSYLSGTPTQISQFNLSKLTHLRLLLVAGEAFLPHHFEKIRREYAGPLLNAYGTTETTVYNSVKRFEKDAPYQNDLGQPLPNTQLYVLDSTLKPIPPGAKGELFISGECITVGYLNLPELNSTRFVANPFQAQNTEQREHHTILYRTGDVVRRCSDGSLAFLGRSDTQVKINGIRIEPEEVALTVASFPGIKQCHVMTQDIRGEGKRLYAYYVAEAGQPVDEASIYTHLRNQLMQSMLPSALIRVDKALPLTPNGKLDVTALSRLTPQEPSAPYFAPQNRTHSLLCTIWSELLHCMSVGIDDDFFQLGGDSIIALQLSSRIGKKFQCKVSVKQVFDFPTIRLFTSHVLNNQPATLGSSEQEPLLGTVPMLPIQSWFFAKPLTTPSHWNQHFAIRTPALNTKRLAEALNQLIQHHDSFRLRYRNNPSIDNGVVTQYYSDTLPTIDLHSLDIRDYSEADLMHQLERIQSDFNLTSGPLYAAAYLTGFKDGSARIWIAAHHLIVDAVSWRILTQDLQTLYVGGTLGPRSSSYRHWTQAVNNYVLEPQEADLWKQTAKAVAAQTTMTQQREVSASHWQFILSAQDTKRLLMGSRRTSHTQFVDLLLTGLGLTLPIITKQKTNYVAIEGHGREAFPGAVDVQDNVGWFTSLYPLSLTAQEDIARTLLTISTGRAQIPNNGIGYGAIAGGYDESNAPLPQFMFNYLGRFAHSSSDQCLTKDDVTVPWQLDPELCGSSHTKQDQFANSSDVDINMYCHGDNLVVEVATFLGAAITERFSMALKTNLQAIASHVATHQSKTSASIHYLTETLRDGNDYEPYIVVNENASGGTLFVMPPGEGGAESYLRNLARYLPNLKLVLFNNIQLYRPMPCFEDIARYYLDFIQQIQTHGPYNFLGWSFGGVLSFEISRQLAQNEESINNLLMIDAFFNARQAAALLGLPEKKAILDPINYRYMPAAETLQQLVQSTDNIVLFKATEPSTIALSEEQTRLFNHYAQSTCNHLDALLPKAAFTLEYLLEQTHFSWVHNQALVLALAEKIQAMVVQTTTTANGESADRAYSVEQCFATETL